VGTTADEVGQRHTRFVEGVSRIILTKFDRAVNLQSMYDGHNRHQYGV
jgi:hypothetical protein